MSNNREYWSKSLDRTTEILMNRQEKDTLKFLKTYKDALVEIQSYTNFLYSKYSVDGQLTLTEMYKYNRYKNMAKEITSIVKSLGKNEKKYMTGELKEIYSDSYTKTGQIIKKVNPKIRTDFNLIPKNAIEKAISYPWSGDDYSSRIWENKRKLIKNLNQTLTQGFVQGKSISNMTKDLTSTMNNSATNCRRLIRTESMHVMASSHHDVYTKAGIKKLEFVTARDDRVCEECSALDGKIFLLNEAPMLPLHPNARSILIPVIE